MLSTFFKPARRAALGLVSVLLLGAAAPAMAEPALWAIKDKDSTIYLFGTIHVLKPDTQWRSARIDGALKASDDLVIEVLGADDPALMQPLVLKYGVDQATPLSKKLNPEDLKRAQTLAQGAGVPPQALEMMRPWLASISLAMLPVIKAGYDPKSGVEQVVQADMKAAGKPASSFETAEQQIRFFADMPVKTEVEMLKSTLDDAAEGPAKIDKMVSAWAAGDVQQLETEFVTEMKAEYADVYEVLLTDRNIDWAQKLKAKLDGSGVSFVAVGAGHLVGPDSVQVQLAKLGVNAERVQ
ncbi:TraB/GumN family protein [Caulobacter sp.]|uniref:TraB/GumN family protein n=1 Tax=Caulobacter sp. TaxID=78 RepID=UPI003BAC580B